MKKKIEMSDREFHDLIYNKSSQESIDRYERAFEARLAYEKNCIAKYDYPNWMCKPSRPSKKGETMLDYAIRFNTTVEEMKKCEREVDRFLENN